MAELRDVFLSAGVEIGTQTTNGNWTIIKVGSNIIFRVLVASSFVDVMTITEAGLITFNQGALNAIGATFTDDLIVNNAVQAKIKFGPVGTEHGMKYDAAGFLQLWTKLNNDFKICNAEDGTVLFSIDSSTKVASLDYLKFPVTPTPIADVNTIDAFKETTFTPTLQDSSFSDAESQTYTSQWGMYQRVAGRIEFEGSMEMLSLGSLTTGDTAYIGGLPETSQNTAGSEGGVTTHKASALALTAGDVLQGYVEINTKRVLLEKFNATTGTVPVLISEITGLGKFSFKGSYYV